MQRLSLHVSVGVIWVLCCGCCAGTSLELTLLKKCLSSFLVRTSPLFEMDQTMWRMSILLVVLSGSCLLEAGSLNAETMESSIDMASSSSQDTSSNSGSGSPISTSGNPSLEDNLLLAYSTQEERDRNIEWIRRLWAFVFHTDVKDVHVLITRDIPLSSGFFKSKSQGHNVSYSVTNAAADSSDIDTDTYRRQFQELLPASTTSYLVTFPQGQVPDSLNMTVIDQIRSPSPVSTIMMEQENIKTFMIYDTISFSYRNMAERNRVLEIIRRAWETAFGKTAMNVDLVVHQDILNTDGTHQFAYVITVLSTQMDWNVQQLETKVRQVLSKANIPSLITPDSTDSGSTTPFSDNGVRSYVFYDTVTMTYSTDAQKTEAVETLRKTWQQVFGSDAWNVQVSVYADKPAQTTATNAHRVSYSIMFSSANKTDWNFETLERKFLSTLDSPSTKTGNGFSFVTVKSQGRDLSETASDSDEDEDSTDSGSEGSGRSDQTSGSSNSDDSDSDSSSAQGRSLDRAQQMKSKSSSSKSSMSMMKSKTTKSSSTATEHYFLSDAIQVEYSSQSQRDQVLEVIRSMWAELLGASADEVQISMNDDFARPGGKKHNIIYHILVESSKSGLDLKSYTTGFWSMVSKSDNVLLQTATRVLTLPYIQGSLDLNAVEAEQKESQVTKKGSVSYKLPYIKGSLDLNVASTSENTEEQQSSQADRTGSKKSRVTGKLPYIKGSLDLNVASTSEDTEEQQSKQVDRTGSKKSRVTGKLPYIKGSLNLNVASTSDDSSDQAEDQSEQTSSSSNKQAQVNSQSSSSTEKQSSSQKTIKFSIQDTQVIAYTTSEELDQFLDSLKTIWIQVLGGKTVVSDVEIKVIMDVSGSGAHAVTYKITGLSTHRYDVAEVMVTFMKALKNAHFSWIMAAQTKSISAESQAGSSKKSSESAEQKTQQSSQSSSASEESEDSEEGSDADAAPIRAPGTIKATTKATTKAAVKVKSYETKSSSSSAKSQKQSQTEESNDKQEDSDSDSDSDSSYGQMVATTKATTTKKVAKIFFNKEKANTNTNQGSSSYQSHKSETSQSEVQTEESNDNTDQDSEEVTTTSRPATKKVTNKIFFDKASQSKYQSQSSSSSFVRAGNGQVEDTLRDAIEVTAGTRAPWHMSTAKRTKYIQAAQKPKSKNVEGADLSEDSADSSSESQMESSSSTKTSKTSSSETTSNIVQGDVKIRGALSIRYTSKSERESAVADIKTRWLSSQALVGLEQPDIKFTSEIYAPQWAQLGGDVEVHTLAYVITGTTRQPIDLTAVRHALRRELVDAKVDYIVVSAQKGGNDETIDDWAVSPSGNSASGTASSANSKTAISSSEGTSSSSSSQTGPVNTYIIYDTLTIQSNDDDEIAAYIGEVEQAWQQVIGNDSDHHLSIYDNQTSGSTQTMKYLVVIFSSSADLNLASLKKQFVAIKPTASGSSQSTSSSQQHSNAVVLRDTISYSYSSETERDDFVDGIEKLWQNALGKNFQMVEAWLFDELVIETSLESEKSSGKTFSQLSYAVVVVSDKYQLSVSALQSSFQQYLITKSVSASKVKACGFQDVLAA